MRPLYHITHPLYWANAHTRIIKPTFYSIKCRIWNKTQVTGSCYFMTWISSLFWRILKAGLIVGGLEYIWKISLSLFEPIEPVTLLLPKKLLFFLILWWQRNCSMIINSLCFPNFFSRRLQTWLIVTVPSSKNRFFSARTTFKRFSKIMFFKIVSAFQLR